jgi:hypothetical protein
MTASATLQVFPCPAKEEKIPKLLSFQSPSPPVGEGGERGLLEANA